MALSTKRREGEWGNWFVVAGALSSQADFKEPFMCFTWMSLWLQMPSGVRAATTGSLHCLLAFCYLFDGEAFIFHFVVASVLFSGIKYFRTLFYQTFIRR